MVVIDDVGGEFSAFVVTGAGWEDANGLYAPTGKVWHDAPVFENDQRCLLSREPHMKHKTGQTCYGWILGQDQKPLYAVETKEILPPASGWRKFNGKLPLPNFQGVNSIADAALVVAQSWKEQGNALFAQKRYSEADAQWTRALGLGNRLRDDMIQVALYSNRSEAKLRQQKWEEAFCDALHVLKWKPAHDKALLRAAVAAREMKRYMESWDFVQQCLAAHPKHPEAKQLLFELEKLLEGDSDGLTARMKLQESIAKDIMRGDVGKIPKGFSAKDINSKKGFKAFSGYSNVRKPAEEKLPLSSMPYHSMGLPSDQVEAMDRFFQEMRDKKAEKDRKGKEEQDMYDKVKLEYRDRATQDRMTGNLEPVDEILPSLKAKKKLLQQTKDTNNTAYQEIQAQENVNMLTAESTHTRKQEAEHVQLSKKDMDEINVLFIGCAGKQMPKLSSDATASLVPKTAERKARLDKAKALVSGLTKQSGEVEHAAIKDDSDLRTLKSQRILAELHRLKFAKNGEPTKFEQTPSEIFCWWTLPLEVASSDIHVNCLQSGAALSIKVNDVVIFDQKLFQQIHSESLIWSIDDGELKLTLSKVKRSERWDQLSDGKFSPETPTEPSSSTEWVEKLRQLILGDDGNLMKNEDLDEHGKVLADRLRMYEQANITNDRRKLTEIEADLRIFSHLVI